MPRFRYSGFDSAGVERSGEVEAVSENDAVQLLAGQGLRLRFIAAATQSAPAPTAAAPVRPAPAKAASTPRPAAQPAPLSAPKAIIRTKPAGHKHMYLWFAQIANMLRAGINPAEALQHVAQRSGGWAHDAFMEMSRAVAGGAGLADAMETYPDIFSPGTVGAVRAGEAGGYTWEACQAISDQSHASHKLLRLYWWAGLLCTMSLLAFPVAYIGRVGIQRAIGTIETGDSSTQAMSEGVMTAIKGYGGWAFAVVLAVYIAGKWWMRRTASRATRHGLAMSAPIVGKRTKGENMAMFSWHLSKLAKAGISPQSSWGLAARAVPNLAYSAELLKQSIPMGERTPISTLLYNSKLFPEEFAPVVETGEMTGTAPQALEQASELGMADARAAEAKLKYSAGCWTLILLIGGGALAFMVMYQGYLSSALQLGDPYEPPTIQESTSAPE